MKKIVIIGGGYGGIKAVRELVKSSYPLQITLIDQHTYHYLQTESYDLVASRIPISETFIYLPTLLKGIDEKIEFVHDQAIGVENNVVITKNGRYEFDYLIIAVGAVTRFLQGFEQKGPTSLGVKSLRSALLVKHFFETELFKRLEPERESFTILIIGGGLSGVEIATEMMSYFREYMQNNALSCGTIHIKLISHHLLKDQHDSVRRYVQKRLQSLSIEQIPAHVQKIEGDRAYLDNEEEIPFDFAIFTGGIAPAPLLERLPYNKDRRGFLLPDPYLRLDSNVYAIGDCAILRDSSGKVVPPTAQSAEESGVIAARNILSEIEGGSLQKANIKLRGMAISLGGKYALAVLPNGWLIKGFLGYLIKKGIERYYKLPLRRLAARGFEKVSACKEKR